MSNNKSNEQMSEQLILKDESHFSKMRGHVRIYRENKDTGEVSLWSDTDNVIVLGGAQYVLMKLLGLHLDSYHGVNYDDIGKDTSLVVPDLNNSGVYQLGIAPEEYTEMVDDISARHYVQGFMIGNGGAGEDSITTKNTNYNFMSLRNPIPFQQTQTELPSSIADKYLGKLRVGASSFSKSYYIKKFDKRPHIFHNWWRDGKRWDELDPVTQNDLGPSPINGAGKTDRIETYGEMYFSLDDDDCLSYFQHEGSTQTAVVNELGLVAYDTVPGTRSLMASLYDAKLKRVINIIFDNNRPSTASNELITTCVEILNPMKELLYKYGNTKMNSFIDNIQNISEIPLDGTVNYSTLQTNLSNETNNIGVESFYNRNGELVITTDNFISILSENEFNGNGTTIPPLSTDEAQRIKLVTYYTFTSIPLESNYRIIINYRIYSN